MASPGRPVRGDYSYSEIVELCREGRYPHASIRAASGRPNILLGLRPKELARLEAAARREGVGALLLGSRVSGPRSRQRGLHPALAHYPLSASGRHASAARPAVAAEIDKTRIKDYGPEDPRTSDLSVILVDAGRSDGDIDALAAALEKELQGLTDLFPVRVFSRVRGRRFRSEEEAFQELSLPFLRESLPRDAPFSEAALREAFRELYARVNLPAPRPAWERSPLAALAARLERAWRAARPRERTA